ncbi:response regulator transcription factor [Dyadobacter sp. CY343]|uniref:response regulator transcription factor n=1 Tax=Dyadobacter sp. CY343 TaxID=2907299 RepID=UPI001F34B838|nr:helix-turn-helix transcriptional regulator [Dyadobacter sp. CY343]MCE7060425.1 helix-turn-helix transcriptional regulator [Dyadobacter sp. CY343]
MFTKREHQILLLIAKGYNSSVIGEKLFISTETIRKHRTNISKKIRRLETGDLKLNVFAIRYAIAAEDTP